MSLIPDKKDGYLEIIIGPMFSGKTSRLLEIYKKCQIANIDSIILNHSSDDRYLTNNNNNNLFSHEKINAPCFSIQNIYNYIENIETKSKHYELSKKILESKVILINEGQFFDDIFESVMMLVEMHKKIVYVCGLDGDYKRNKFGRLLDLVPFCDNVSKLPSLCTNCSDGTFAIFTNRTNTNCFKKILIGGKDDYSPLCRKCYLSKNLTIKIQYNEQCKSLNAPRATDNSSCDL